MPTTKVYKVYNSVPYPYPSIEHHCQDEDWGKCNSYCREVTSWSKYYEYTFVSATSKQDAKKKALEIYDFKDSFNEEEVPTTISVEECFKLSQRRIEIYTTYGAGNRYSKILEKPTDRLKNVKIFMQQLDTENKRFYNAVAIRKEYEEAKKELSDAEKLVDELIEEMEDIHLQLEGEHSYAYQKQEGYSSFDDRDKRLVTETKTEREAKKAEELRQRELKQYLELKAKFEK